MTETDSTSAGAASDKPTAQRKRGRRSGSRPRKSPAPAEATAQPSEASPPEDAPTSPIAPDTEAAASQTQQSSPAQLEETGPAENLSGTAGELQSPLIEAMERIEKAIATLKIALQELEDAYDLIDEAERQKIADENEIASLRNALNRLHQPVSASDPALRRRHSPRDSGDSRPQQKHPAPQQSREQAPGQGKGRRRRRRRSGPAHPNRGGEGGAPSHSGDDTSAPAREQSSA